MGRGFTIFGGLLSIFDPPCAYCGEKPRSGYYKTHNYLSGKKFCKIACINKYLREFLPKFCKSCGYKFKAYDYNNDHFVYKNNSIHCLDCRSHT